MKMYKNPIFFVEHPLSKILGTLLYQSYTKVISITVSPDPCKLLKIRIFRSLYNSNPDLACLRDEPCYISSYLTFQLRTQNPSQILPCIFCQPVAPMYTIQIVFCIDCNLIFHPSLCSLDSSKINPIQFSSSLLCFFQCLQFKSSICLNFPYRTPEGFVLFFPYAFQDLLCYFSVSPTVFPTITGRVLPKFATFSVFLTRFPVFPPLYKFYWF